MDKILLFAFINCVINEMVLCEIRRDDKVNSEYKKSDKRFLYFNIENIHTNDKIIVYICYWKEAKRIHLLFA